MSYAKYIVKKQAFVLITLAVVAIDQVSKFCIRTILPTDHSIPQEGLFRITHIENPSGIFGLPLNRAFLIVLAIIVMGAILFVYYRYPLSREKLIKIALGFLMGGAIGNLVDRLFIGKFGEVTDFIDIGVWPVFNLADSAIVIGVILIAYYFVFIYKKGKAKARVHGTED